MSLPFRVKINRRKSLRGSSWRDIIQRYGRILSRVTVGYKRTREYRTNFIPGTLVYVAGFPCFKLTKIGITADIKTRIYALRDEARLFGIEPVVRQQLRPLLLITSPNPGYLERRLHERLCKHARHGKEWFALYDVDVADHVVAILESDHEPHKFIWK